MKMERSPVCVDMKVSKHADISIDINRTKFTTEGIILVQ